jgi:hypothetical protein
VGTRRDGGEGGVRDRAGSWNKHIS